MIRCNFSFSCNPLTSESPAPRAGASDRASLPRIGRFEKDRNCMRRVGMTGSGASCGMEGERVSEGAYRIREYGIGQNGGEVWEETGAITEIGRKLLRELVRETGRGDFCKSEWRLDVRARHGKT